MGSSPIVSTAKCLVTGLLVVGDRCGIGGRAHYVPTTDGLWRVIAGTGRHGRFLAEALEVVDDVGVLAVDDVLVPERRGGGRVADAGHERLEAGAARGGESRGGVAEVV